MLVLEMTMKVRFYLVPPPPPLLHHPLRPHPRHLRLHLRRPEN